MPLLNTASKLYVGGTPAQAVYRGTTLVWPVSETQLQLPDGATRARLEANISPAMDGVGVDDLDVSWFGSLILPGAQAGGMTLINKHNAKGAVPDGAGWYLMLLGVSNPFTATFAAVRPVQGQQSVTAPVTITSGRIFGLRATRNKATGVMRLYHSPKDPPTWTQIAQATRVSGAINNNYQVPVIIGGYDGGLSYPTGGFFRRAEIRVGPASEYLMGAPDVTTLPLSATSFTENGTTWTMRDGATLAPRPKPT